MTKQDSCAALSSFEHSGFLRHWSFVILIHPLAAFGNEDRQFFHHELGFAKCADHMRAGRYVPFPRHLLAGVAAPALHVSAACENTAIDFCRVVFVQPGFTSAVNVVAVVKHETRTV